MSGSVKGIDVSTWQHPEGQPIDFEQVVQAGYRFVIIKATQGAGYLNPWLDRDYDDAFGAGLLIGAYHYFEPGEDVDAQAKNFVGSLIGKRLDMGAWLDFEPGVIVPYVTPPQAVQFLAACADGRPGCGLYCTASVWDELKAANVTTPRLWVPSWGGRMAPDGTNITQDQATDVPGVPADVNVDLVFSVRGLNIPTAPATKAEVRSMTPTEPEPEKEPESPQEPSEEKEAEDTSEPEGPEHQGP